MFHVSFEVYLNVCLGKQMFEKFGKVEEPSKTNQKKSDEPCHLANRIFTQQVEPLGNSPRLSDSERLGKGHSQSSEQQCAAAV